MTRDEFMKLEVGDEILGMNNDLGEVSAASESRGVKSVSILWGPGAPPFTLTSNQTAWMHWTRPEVSHDEEAE